MATTTDEAQAQAQDREFLWGRRQDLLVKALTNRRYQLERQRIMEWREGAVKVASLVAGSAAIARLADSVLPYLAGALILPTAAALVFGWGAKARDAAKRAAEWVALETEIHAAGERDFTEAQLNAWQSHATRIESGEPAQNRAMLEWCYRRACEDLDRRPKAVGTLPNWRLLLPHSWRPIP